MTNESDIKTEQQQEIVEETKPETVEVSKEASDAKEPKQHVEKTYTKDELAKIVNAEVGKAKGKTIIEMQNQINQQAAVQVNQQNMPNQQGKTALTPQEWAAQAATQMMITNFASKLENDYQSDPEVKGAIDDLRIPNVAPLVLQSLSELDNTKDVLLEFRKMPDIYANIMSVFGISTGLGNKKLREFSESIKKNKDAVTNYVDVSEPLKQIKPSKTSIGSGSTTVTDLRKQSWLRK